MLKVYGLYHNYGNETEMLLGVLEIIHFCEVIDCRKSRLQRYKVVRSAVFNIISSFEKW